MNKLMPLTSPTPKRRGHRTLRILALLAILLAVLIAIPASPGAAVSSASFGWFWPLSISVILLAVLIVAAPRIVARTGLRDRAINAIVASPSVTASSDSASFGWFSPLSVHGLHLNSTNEHVDVSVEDITAEQAPYQLWWSAPDLGTIRVEKPHVTLELPLDVQIQRRRNLLEPTFTAMLRNAGLTVRLGEQTEPVIDVDGVNMTLRVEKAEEGRVLTLDPTVIFDRRKLSPKLANQLLHLFDPTMSDIAQVNGAVSLSLEKLRIPIGVPRDLAAKRVELEGKLVLHEVSTAPSNPMRQALVQLVAVMNGKDASKVVHLTQNDEIRFHVRDGRLYHERLRIGLPDIDPELVLISRGSVGLDNTLDLFVELPRLDRALRKEKGPARCHITGTIANPRITIEDASLVLRQHDRKAPIIAADGINLNMQVEHTAWGRVLAVEPVEVFKKKELSLGVAAGLVKLLAPDVQSDREVAGAISLSFHKLRLPLGFARDQEFKQLEAEGKLTLHQVASEVKSPLWRGLIRLLADMNGKQPSNVIRLVEDSEIHFQVRDGRLHHDGQRIGFPEIDPELVISSRGSIGIDETLDLYLEMPRLRKAVRDNGPLECHVTGTIREPKISLQNAPLVVRWAMTRRVMRVYAWACRNPLLTGSLHRATQWGSIGFQRVAGLRAVFRPSNGCPHPDGQHSDVPEIDPELVVSSRDSIGIDETLAVHLEMPDVQEVASNNGPPQCQVTGTTRESKTSLRSASVVVSWGMAQRIMGIYGWACRNSVLTGSLRRATQWGSIGLQRVAGLPGVFGLGSGRLHQDRQRSGVPEIDAALVVSSRDSIGIDETPDVHLEMPRLQKVACDNGPPLCHVTGTIRESKTSLQSTPVVVSRGMAQRIMGVYAWACRDSLLTSSLRRATQWGSFGLQRVAGLPAVVRPGWAFARISAFCRGLRPAHPKDRLRRATVTQLKPRHPAKDQLGASTYLPLGAVDNRSS
jgi:hypothetical protein